MIVMTMMMAMMILMITMTMKMMMIITMIDIACKHIWLGYLCFNQCLLQKITMFFCMIKTNFEHFIKAII